MDGALIFCRDSILRFRSSYDDSTTVPLLSIQECLEGDEPLFLLKYFHHRVIIEHETTLSAIFLALEPWAKILSTFLNVDVGAYIAEIRKPSEVEAAFDWIGIQKVTSIYRAYQHSELLDGDDLESYFNRERTPTEYFDIETICTANGYIKGDQEYYNISRNIHEVKNVPVVVSDRQVLASYGSEKNTLLNHNHIGVSANDKLSYIQGETAFSFYEVMEALFNDGLFYPSPKTANHSLEAMKEIIGVLETGKHEQPDSAGYTDACDQPDMDDIEKMKVEIAAGVFKPMIEHLEAEQDHWQYVKAICDSDSELPIRIGQIVEAKLPEYRFSTFILNSKKI
jgi:hypothetical protein